MALAIVVWLVPLQHGFYADAVITDIPTYRAAFDHIAAGDVPYRDFSLEYPPLAAGLFWLAGVLPGTYCGAFSGLMLLALCATAVGVVALARALGLDQRRQALAGVAVAVSPAAGGQPGGDALRPRAGRAARVDHLGGRHRALRAGLGAAGGGDPAEAGAAGPDPGVRDLAAPPRRHAPRAWPAPPGAWPSWSP